MQSGTHTYTPSGRLRKAMYRVSGRHSEVCTWFPGAWDKVPPDLIDLILSGFRKSGIKSTGEESDHPDEEPEFDSARVKNEFEGSSIFEGFEQKFFLKLFLLVGNQIHLNLF